MYIVDTNRRSGSRMINWEHLPIWFTQIGPSAEFKRTSTDPYRTKIGTNHTVQIAETTTQDVISFEVIEEMIEDRSPDGS